MFVLTIAIIETALREATDQQFASEVARRSQAKRKVKSGGRNGGRPKNPPPNPTEVCETSDTAL